MTRASIVAVCALSIVSGLLGVDAWAQTRPRIAILSLDRIGVSNLDGRLLTHLLSSGFVNTTRYTVLEREDIDKILREQSMEGVGVVSETDAVRLGRILQVQKIVTGTLMRLQGGQYFIEVRMIDVETSTIDKSGTEKCENTDQFGAAAQRIVQRMSGVMLSDNGPTVSRPAPLLAVPIPTTTDRVAEVPAAPSKPDPWRDASLSESDHDRFAASGLSLREWSLRERRSPMLAASLGALPLVSGLYYDRAAGLGAFVTMTELLAGAGIARCLWKRDYGERLWVWSGLFAGVNVADIVASAVAATTHNSRLDRIQRSGISAHLIVSPRVSSAQFTFSF